MSYPPKSHLKFPNITPSTFTIGMIKNVCMVNKFLEVREFPCKKASVPYITNEATVSPGCYLAIITIADVLLVPIYMIGTLFFISDVQSIV